MSFMNPVDMVDEDAADLQFPKVKPLGDPVQRFAYARQDENTRRSVVSYKPYALHRQLEQLEELARDDNSSVPVSLTDFSRCATCRCSLTEPYIKCSECLDILLCLQCFSKGREAFSHRNNHAYIIVRDNIQVFAEEPHWTARDERILLRTLRTQGYGNWEAISQALDQRHTPSEVRRHYHDCYFGGIFERLLNLKHARHSYLPERMPYVFKMRSLDPPRHDDIASMQFKMSAGYRCARGDFDTPYDTSAESLLSIMVDHRGRDDDHETTESESERGLIEELQQGLVRAYNNRLKERQRRYKIMQQHGLIMPNRTISWISKYVHAFNSDAMCMRFLGLMQICPDPIQFDMLLESLRYYRELHTRLNKLYNLRQQGVRTNSAAKLYIRLHKERQKAQRDYSRQKQMDNIDWQQLVQHYESNRNGEQLPLGINTKFYTMNTRRKASPIEIGDLPGYSKLDEGERKLCSVARLVPQSYLEYKNQLVSEHTKLGYLRLADARRLIKIDVNKTRQIYDFLLEHGHISRPPSFG
ncbi:transcriptional adapter 2A isoform X2 [Drosophila eugracilis]|uniref:transcriptional adapter 2A isoform X2 n=1 Tax=Drosophila eugracilis TaxID=29029 RepID=UPI001BDA0585|nr:transcriptional adapter 2A isoform X2 [Drosophila eugracilis]